MTDDKDAYPSNWIDTSKIKSGGIVSSGAKVYINGVEVSAGISDVKWDGPGAVDWPESAIGTWSNSSTITTYTPASLVPTYEAHQHWMNVNIPDQINVVKNTVAMSYRLEIVLFDGGQPFTNYSTIYNEILEKYDKQYVIGMIEDIIRRLFNSTVDDIIKTRMAKASIPAAPTSISGYLKAKANKAKNDAEKQKLMEKLKNIKPAPPTEKSALFGNSVHDLIAPTYDFMTKHKGNKAITVAMVTCPQDKCVLGYAGKARTSSVYDMIMHLNDEHDWKRETQIADWLDELHDSGIIDISIEIKDPEPIAQEADNE